MQEYSEKGSDGNCFPNGFKPRVKFDGTSGDGKRSLGIPDGYLDKDDAIFSELKFWMENFLSFLIYGSITIPIAIDRVSRFEKSFTSNMSENF
jgi:hypothetical protein